MLPDYDAPHYRNAHAHETFPKYIVRNAEGDMWRSNTGEVPFMRQLSANEGVEMAHLDGSFEPLPWAANMEQAMDGLYMTLPCSGLFAYAILRHQNGG